MAGGEEGDLELGEGEGSGQEIGITERTDDDDDDDETGEAWDEIGGSEGAESDAGKATAKAVDS